MSHLVLNALEGALLAAFITAAVLLWIDIRVRRDLIAALETQREAYGATERTLGDVSKQLTALGRNVERGFSTDEERLRRIRKALEHFQERSSIRAKGRASRGQQEGNP